MEYKDDIFSDEETNGKTEMSPAAENTHHNRD
jgi:hypothetical protein